MPPAGGPKRKRSDRNFSGDDVPRASPHRPHDLDLAKQAHPQSPSHGREDSGRFARRQSRGGRNAHQQSHDAKPASPMASAPTIRLPAAASTDGPVTNGQAIQQDDPSPSDPIPERSFTYEHISDEIVQSWSSEGREKIKAKLIDFCQDEPDIDLGVLVEELIEAATTGRIDTYDAGLVIKETIVSVGGTTEADSVNPIQDAIVGSVPILFAEETPNPHIAELADFLSATEISPDVLRVELDAKLLEQLGLIRNTFHRQVIRKQTNALYRQANYNLLREESEGFSKLVTEMFTTSGNEVPSGDVVNATVEKVKAMIGAFDLDVGRSLDVILDVCGSVLVKQYRFFVKFLRASPWWPRTEGGASETFGSFSVTGGLPMWALPGIQEWYLTDEQRLEFSSMVRERDNRFWDEARRDGLSAYFQLGRHHAANDAEVDVKLDAESRRFLNETGTIPYAGSREAAQLLGFKLRYYAPGAEGDSVDGTPRNLIYLAALLMKIGFISLHDLYPHLWRPDSEMDELKQIKQKEKEEREKAARPGAGASNALARAGALPDESAPGPLPTRLRESGTRASTPAKETESEKTAVKEPIAEKPDQKVLLLQSLLAIGALPEALFILGRFPWMTDLIPELPEYINRILHHSLSYVYDELRPLSSRSSLRGQQPLYDTDAPGLPKGHAQLEQPPQRRTLRWPLLDRDDTEVDGVNYRFYWDEWNDNIPVCRSVDDVFTLTKTLLPLVGAKIGQDTALILKFTRIGKASLRQEDTEANKERWLDLVKRVLLPSLSLTKSNPGVVNEVFELISTFSTEIRYRMYLEWSKGDTSRTNDMRGAFGLARDETRDVLKKISKTNVKPMARALAKIAYANPHIVITTALPQIESYDSIADVFVEGSRYFTDLGYDVLTWALVVSMGQDNRVGIQADGIFTSKWLTALSHFIGKVYKRYNLMKPGPILQYVAKQLSKGNNVDLVILEQLIVAMAGIAPDTNYNDTQLIAMGGGPLLQSQTILQLLDQRHTSKQTAKRLMKALHDCDLISNLLLAMAQQRQACVFQESTAPLKAVGHNFDEVTRVLGQYLDLLKTNLTAEEFQRHIPSTATMLNEWDIPADVAFWIGRPLIQKQISDFDKDNIQTALVKDINGDVDMKEEEASEEDGEAVETEDVPTSAATPTENELTGNADEAMPDVEEVSEQQWHPVLRTVMDEVETQLSDDVIELIGVGFYVTFWQLSLYDISVPGKSYEDEMSRNKKKIAGITADRSNVSSSGAKQRENQIKALKQLNDDLLAENRQHLKAYSESKARLTREKDQWFVAKSRVSKELNYSLMEHCFLPRILLSPLDAYFCFKFAKILHTLATVNFRTLGFYDNVFHADRLTSIFFMCTSKEAENLGKFLCEVLKDLSRWYAQKAVYEREAFGSRKNLPGFALKLENGKPQKLLDYEKFRDVLYKWHSHLYSALTKCLTSSEYMHIRNAISILRTVAAVFPAVDFHGRSLQKSVDKLRESDREDLKVASHALLGTLTRRQKEWINPEIFRKGQGAVVEKPTSTPEPPKEENKQKVESNDVGRSQDTKMKDVPTIRSAERAETPAAKDAEKTPSTHSKDGGRSPSRTGTPLPPRPTRDTNTLRPPRAENRQHDLPRRVSPPPRFNSNALPARPENDPRDNYREGRPPRGAPPEQPRPDSRSGYPLRHTSDRGYESSHDPSHRYPRQSDRPSMLDREERPPRREHEPRLDPRAGHEERRYNERDIRADRDVRLEREPRVDRELRHERDHTRNTGREQTRPSERSERIERPERSDREYGRPEHSDRRRDDSHQISRHEAQGPSRGAPPSAPAAVPAPPASSAPPINPERAALIQASDDRPGVSIRGQAQDRARSSRPTSPRRDDDRKHNPRGDREERHERRPDQNRNAPTSSSQVPPRNMTSTGPPARDSRGHGRPPVDMSHGRLEQDGGHRPPSRPERAAEAEPPSGPRPRPPNSSIRNAESTQPPRSGPNRQPPSGPGRHSRHNSQAEPASSPTGPDTSGVHPDRLGNLPPVDQPRNQRPPPLQAGPPSGPRGAPTGPAATAPSPNTRAPPSGPQADTPTGRGQRHPMATVNNTLAQAANGPRPPAGRGRGGMRQNSISYSGGMPPSPVGGPPNQGFNGPQPDLINNNPNGMPIQPRGPPNRQDNQRGEDDRRSTRSHQHEDRNQNPRGDRDGGYSKEDGNMRRDRGPPPQGRNEDGPPPRSGPRGYPRGPNPNGPGEEGPPNNRKHARDDSSGAPYGGGGRGGRGGGETKRQRRGG